jgi:holo-[acyl-carrier protein] synthase
MLIMRTGIDLIELDRLEQLNPAIRARFLKRVFTQRELDQAQERWEALTGLFAAKEAVSKALGTGIGPVAWQEIEILHKFTGEPVLELHGKALQVAENLGLKNWSISITHSRTNAAAVAVAIGETSLQAD